MFREECWVGKDTVPYQGRYKGTEDIKQRYM